MDRGRDRDENGVPDWQEDENYRDEVPRGAPLGGGGCLLGPLSLTVVVPAALGRAVAGYLSRVSLKVRSQPQ